MEHQKGNSLFYLGRQERFFWGKDLVTSCKGKEKETCLLSKRNKGHARQQELHVHGHSGLGEWVYPRKSREHFNSCRRHPGKEHWPHSMPSEGVWASL